MLKLFANLGEGKLFGHPIHMMLLHFPSALLPLAAALDLLHLFAAEGWQEAYAPVLIVGVAGGWLAALFGLWDLTRLEAGGVAQRRALLHGGVNAMVLTLFTTALVLVSNELFYLRLALEVSGTVMLLFGNKLGGDLVLRYRVGVEPDGSTNARS